ncbi:hypothetical protein Dsin_015843 [Dipteronia sinensis]|uniref:Uncharacterized protein n=1 Tax=Dipteronia sinensis TaxID=43782 RepID=A0AAE0AD69_9ROSI|nr:hypothetical protein Dsin_015843 [Dipteronia sinensis]
MKKVVRAKVLKILDVDDHTIPEDFTILPKWVPFHSNIAYRYFEFINIFNSVIGDVFGVNDWLRFGLFIKDCDVVALPTTASNTDEETDTWRWMKEWLDKQKRNYVIYVAFGSVAKPSQTHLTELALGLELSELPFFRVLRTRRGSYDTELVELLDGFEERTKGRGVVWTSWAPQL